jgi:hypothetical protein
MKPPFFIVPALATLYRGAKQSSSTHLRQFRAEAIDFAFRFAIDEEGYRWSKRELLLHRAVDAHELAPIERERRAQDRPLFQKAFMAGMALW